LFVHRDDQVRGLTHLLTLALRILTLFEVLIRRGPDQSGEELAGLYPGQAKRTNGSSDGAAGAGGDCRSGTDPDAGRERSTPIFAGA
jgi:hypothetical protein